jgi:ferredoxin
MSVEEAQARLYVKVDLAKCCGYTLCAEACPEVFKLDEQGLAYVESSLVPEGLEEKARAGANVCPEDAIVCSDTPFDD